MSTAFDEFASGQSIWSNGWFAERDSVLLYRGDWSDIGAEDLKWRHVRGTIKALKQAMKHYIRFYWIYDTYSRHFRKSLCSSTPAWSGSFGFTQDSPNHPL